MPVPDSVPDLTVAAPAHERILTDPACRISIVVAHAGQSNTIFAFDCSVLPLNGPQMAAVLREAAAALEVPTVEPEVL